MNKANVFGIFHRTFLIVLCGVLLFSNNKVSAQTTITIGDVNSSIYSERYPFNGFYDYSWGNALYLQSEIGGAATLTKVAFYVTNTPSNYTMNSQKIYVRHTTSTGFSDATYPGTSGFTLVYDGSITYNGSGWKEVTLTTAFNYNGTDNLEFLFENRDGSYATGYPTFKYTSGYSTYRLRRDYKDASFPSTCTNCARLTAALNIQLTMGCNSTLSLNPTSSTICNGSNVSITASGNNTYSWSPSTGLNATTGATVTANPTTTTTYTVTGVDGDNCSQSKTITVTVNALPVIITNPVSPSYCTGGNISITASGASTYSWSPSSGLSATTGATVTADPSSTSTYTITGTDANGCVNTKNVTVTVNSFPTITASPSSPSLCAGGNVSITASGASTYSWSPSTGLSATTGTTVTANPSSATTYTITGTSAAGCVNTQTVTVTVNSLPTVSVSPTSSTICNGANTSLTASGASAYSWSPTTGLSATTGASVSASPATTTTYTVTGTDANSCSQSQTVTVTVNALPSITVSPSAPAICEGSNVSLTAIGASTYSWSPSTGLSATTVATVIASPTSTTIYTVTGTDASGCVNTQMVTVTVNAIPSVSISPSSATVCNGTGVSLTASAASTYSWSPATGLSATTGATVTATPTTNTTYTVTGTSNGCSSTATVSVSVGTVNAGTAVANGSSDPCSNSQAILSLSGNSTSTIGNGTLASERYPFNGFYDFSWSNALYLQSELGAAGTLNKVSFYVDNAPSNYTMNSQKIYVRHTSSGSYSDNNYPGTSGFTLVYDGSITYNGSGWKEITLSTPFSYNGTDNLEFLFENRDGTYATGYPLFRYTSGYADARLRRDYKDASFPSTCTNCARLTAVLNMQFNLERTLSTFVKWQYSSDNITYADLPSGTSLPCTTQVNSSTYFRAVLSNGSCTANSASAYYVTSNNYYVNDNISSGDVFCSAVGSSSNDGRSASKPKASISDVLATYDLGACDTIFVDKGNYTEEVVINYVDGGSSSGYVTLYGAGIDVAILAAPSGGHNINLNQPDYIRIQGFTLNSTQSTKNNLMINESRYNIISGNKLTHSGYTNIHISGDEGTSNLDADLNRITNNTIQNSATTGYGIYLTGDCDSVEIDSNTITMSSSAPYDAIFLTTHSIGNGANTVYLYPTNVKVHNNVIGTQNWGVSIFGYDHAIDNTKIYNNTITVALKSDASAAGIWIAGIGSVSTGKTLIYNNRIIGGSNGIYYTTSSDYSKVYNNYFSGNDYGLYVSTSTADNGEIYFNSFYNSITNLYFAFSSGANWKIKNNILYTTGSSSTNACIHNGNAVVFDACDYNLFYAPNGGSIARFNSTNYSTLASFQALDHADETTLGDEHSASGNPQYVNTGDNNLDIPGTSPATLTGVTISDITTDIYNDTRFSSPCIGADEAAPLANAGADSTICAGQSVQLAATGGNSYSWSPATGLSATNIANPVASPTVTTSYTVTATIGAQSSTDVVVVTVNPIPLVDAGANIGVCPGATVQIGGTPSASGGTGPYTYTWSPSTGLSVTNIANPTATPAITTNYTLSVSDNAGCSANDNILVTVNPVPTADAGSDQSVCIGSTVQIGGSPTATGGTSPYSYTWTPGTGLNSASSPNPSAIVTTSITYTLTIADNNGCSSSDEITLTEFNLPTVTVSPSSATILIGSSVTLTAGGASTYSWSPTIGLSSTSGTSVDADPANTTTYTVLGVDANGCTGSATSIVTVDQTVGLYINTTKVPGFQYSVSGAGISATYMSGTNVQLTPTLPTGSSTFAVVIDVVATSSSNPAKFVFDINSVGAISNVRIELNSQLVPLSTDLYGIINNKTLVFYKDGIPSEKVLDRIQYALNLKNGLALTPNSTTFNQFQFSGIPSTATAELTVFNKASQQVFQTSDPVNTPWDGKISNAVVPGLYKFNLVVDGETFNGQFIINDGQ